MADKKIIVIPPSHEIIQAGGLFHGFLENKKHLRMAAYCRVSTDLDNQEMSFSTQVAYYTNYIKETPNWTLVHVYADEARSGTSRKNRVEFNRMIRDALNGKIDYIITKSISRFSRNQHDTYECIKALREHTPPIGVYFQNENLDSLDPATEFVFSILSLVAQNQSQSISMNIQWGNEKRFASGWTIVNPNNVYGYRESSKGEWLIDEDQAATIRFIYQKYQEYGNMSEIANVLNNAGVPSPNGSIWRTDNIGYILRNEKYAGDVISQKTYTTDNLSHKMAINRGEKAKYYNADHHTVIIDRRQWNQVQVQLSEMPRGRKRQKRPYRKLDKKERAALFAILRCDEMRFHRITENSRTKKRKNTKLAVWKCDVKYKKAVLGEVPSNEECLVCTQTYSEIGIEQSFMEALYRIKRNYDKEGEKSWIAAEFQKTWRNLQAQINCDELNAYYNDLADEVAVLEESLKKFQDQKRLNHSIKYAAGERICNNIINGLKRDILERNMEMEEIQGKIGLLPLYKMQYQDFIRNLQQLPEMDCAGDRILISGIDRMGSIRRTYAGSAIRTKRKVTEDVIDITPNFLSFRSDIFSEYIVSGKVQGDKIEYLTTFGVEIETNGNSRRPHAFVGFKYCAEDGILHYIRGIDEIPKSKP